MHHTVGVFCPPLLALLGRGEVNLRRPKFHNQRVHGRPAQMLPRIAPHCRETPSLFHGMFQPLGILDVIVLASFFLVSGTPWNTLAVNHREDPNPESTLFTSSPLKLELRLQP